MSTEVQLWASTLLCQFDGRQVTGKMTFGIAGARVLCNDHAEPFRQLMLYPPKAVKGDADS